MQQPVPRIVLFGSEGGFSRRVLEQLLRNDELCVRAIVMPGIATPRSTDTIDTGAIIPLERPPDSSSLAGLADARQIPVIRTPNGNDPAILTRLARLDADLYLVACFPFKLAAAIWRLAGKACWNIHPSLLPKYRGPSPIAWQLQHEETDTGISLHEVSDQLDGGDIVAQQSIRLPAQTDADAINQWIAEHGIELFIRALSGLQNGTLATTKQDESAASYFPRIPAKQNLSTA